MRIYCDPQAFLFVFLSNPFLSPNATAPVIRLIPHNSSSRRLGESKDAMLRDYTEQQRQ
jgi:hypothetical protein